MGVRCHGWERRWAGFAGVGSGLKFRRRPADYPAVKTLLAEPLVRDALVALGVWVVFRLLGTVFSLREVLVAMLLVGVLHLSESGVLEGVSGPYIAQFVELCTEYADRERCRCAREELERRLPKDEFAEFAFKFYVDRMPPPILREALSDCS
jgi:hypothetical protein